MSPYLAPGPPPPPAKPLVGMERGWEESEEGWPSSQPWRPEEEKGLPIGAGRVVAVASD